MPNVKRIIHIFNDSSEIIQKGEWEIQCHSQSHIINYLRAKDLSEGTTFETSYNAATDPPEFYKYVILYYEGGVFARYKTLEEITDLKQKDIEKLVKYSENRQISLFQCPSAILVGFIHHPQLLSMLSEPIFHPLNMLYKKINETVGHKTLVTSLPLSQYLEKIKSDFESRESLKNEKLGDHFYIGDTEVNASVFLGTIFGLGVSIGLGVGYLFTNK